MKKSAKHAAKGAGPHLTLTLSPEQQAVVRQFSGRDIEALDFTVEQLEDRIAPAAMRVGRRIDTVPLPD